MRSSRTITLFSVQPETKQGPTSYVASGVFHVCTIFGVVCAFIYTPQFRLPTPDVYMMQHVNLNIPYPPIQKYGGSGSMYPKSSSSGSETSTHEHLAAPASSRLQLAHRKLAPQTLIEPDIDPNKMLPKETPLPALMLWSGAKQKIKVITPPQPQPPATVFSKPKLNIPNREQQLADINMASARFPAKLQLPITPSNTTPVILKRDVPLERMPETSSVSSIEPTPAAVLSASDLHMTQGAAAMPAANQTAVGNENGGLGTGRAEASVRPGNGDSGSSGTERGEGKGQGTSGGKSAGPGSGSGSQGTGTAANGSSSGAGSGQGTGHNAGAGAGSNTGAGSGDGEGESITRISHPKNGQFGVVVVGSSMDEQYPETAAVWKGRMAYSVYLHVGMAKSWILQYSLPRTSDSASAGTAHLEAPWPYYIVRPNFNPADSNADSVMVHGYVNESGHFESLAVVFPADFAHEQLVLGALQQWQFRPGTEDGQIAKLEVLLIIPEITE
jgi:hypothetical protein